MTKTFTFVLAVVGCVVVAVPAHAQSGQKARKTTAPAVSGNNSGQATKKRAIHHPTASQRFPNAAALTVVTMPDGSKRLRRPDKVR